MFNIYWIKRGYGIPIAFSVLFQALRLHVMITRQSEHKKYLANGAGKAIYVLAILGVSCRKNEVGKVM